MLISECFIIANYLIFEDGYFRMLYYCYLSNLKMLILEFFIIANYLIFEDASFRMLYYC